MSSKSKLDWYELRRRYVFGNTRSVNAFLEANDIKVSGFVTRKTKGWREDKEIYERELEDATRKKLIASLSETNADVRKRQASIAKFMQEIALRALEKYEPQSFSEALRALQIGLKEEREALNLNNNVRPADYTQPPFMLTRYAQKLQSLSGQELVKVVQKLVDEDKSKIIN